MGQEIERAAELLERLYGSGAISPDATDALLAQGTAAAEIGRGLGERATARELLLASVLVDDSTSIGGLVTQIHSGHAVLLEALRAESGATEVEVLTRALNRGVVSPYEPIARATPLTHRNFNTSQQVSSTPLYLQSLLTLGTVMAKAQEIEDAGGAVRTFTLLITDGRNEGTAARTTAADVRVLVTDMLEFSTDHIVAGMGIGEHCDFRAVFREMGIPERWILTSGASVAELREVFRKVAASLTLAASSASAFRALLAGPPRDA